MYEAFTPLLIATISIAFFHCLLGPDHYMPFIMIGKARHWSKIKLIFIAFVAGLGHVGSSIVLGSIGIMLGFGLNSLQGIESSRSNIGIFLFIGFGVAYALWGLKQARSHHHHHLDLNKKKIVTFWTIFAIFVLGPCEPLIPLMFAATGFGWHSIVLICMIFASITIIMMIALSYFGYIGINLIKLHVVEKYSHSLAGAIIALTGVFLII